MDQDGKGDVENQYYIAKGRLTAPASAMLMIIRLEG
jgi:hypothetical protein